MPLVCRHHTPGPPASRLLHLSPPASHALPSTRQEASAFNQPLSFNTSSVTDMSSMFWVRSARALGPQALSRAFSPCMPLVCRHHTPGPPASRLAPLPPRIACPPSDSAVGDGLQPAAELRHLQRHRHELHVLRALRACPWPPSLESGLFPVHAACVPPPHHRPSRLPARTPLPPHRMPSLRLGSGARWPSTSR